MAAASATTLSSFGTFSAGPDTAALQRMIYDHIDEIFGYSKDSRETPERLTLSCNILTQLLDYPGNVITSPDAPLGETLDGEIIRGVARASAFLALARCSNDGVDDSYKMQAYEAFTHKQPVEQKLSYKSFQELCRQFKEAALAFGDQRDFVNLIATISFLTKTKKADERLKKAGIEPAQDSEQFLSQIARACQAGPELMPACLELQAKGLLPYLIEVFPEGAPHLRHLKSIEGGESVWAKIRALVPKADATPEQKRAWQLWKWRWMSNLFGFRGGPGALYYTEAVHRRIQSVFEAIEQSVREERDFFEIYFAKVAEQVGFASLEGVDGLAPDDHKFIMHMVCKSDPEPNPERQQQILRGMIVGFQNFKRENPDSSLVVNWKRHFVDPETSTPTFLPAVFRKSLSWLEEEGKRTEEATNLAMQFTCWAMDQIYAPAELRGTPRSCYALSRIDKEGAPALRDGDEISQEDWAKLREALKTGDFRAVQLSVSDSGTVLVGSTSLAAGMSMYGGRA